MAESQKKKTDAALNVGTAVRLSIGTRRVRQLRWRTVKALTRDLYDLAVAVKTQNPDVDWTSVTNAQAVEVVFNSVLSTVDGAADVVERMLVDVSDLSAEEVAELSLGDFQKLLLAALEEQAEVVADFFALRAAVGDLLAKRRSPATGKRG